MAKVKATDSTIDTETPLIQPTSNPETPPVNEEPEKDIPPIALSTLKVYPQYVSLYIDKHGGAYTPETKENVRGNAQLYNNPYHQ